MQALRTLSSSRRALLIAGALGIALSAASCSLLTMGSGIERPKGEEFGLGPRTSAQGLYSATLVANGALKPRTMQTLQVLLADASGTAVENAAITIDGGMPQHGHGLPTRPRVTRYLGDGVYEIEGVRFNMGGWWEFRLAVDAPAGSDTLTFNLDL